MSDDLDALFETVMLGTAPPLEESTSPGEGVARGADSTTVPAASPGSAAPGPGYSPHAVAASLARGIAQTLPQGWPARLSFDVALGMDEEEDILTRHGIPPAAWAVIRDNPLFRREVGEHRRRMGEEGVTFKAKAKVQAEEYLKTLDVLVTDPVVDPRVRLEAIRSVVKWAGLEPRPESEGAGFGNAIQVNINL
jgi:hypothetical protein